MISDRSLEEKKQITKSMLRGDCCSKCYYVGIYGCLHPNGESWKSIPAPPPPCNYEYFKNIDAGLLEEYNKRMEGA